MSATRLKILKIDSNIFVQKSPYLFYLCAPNMGYMILLKRKARLTAWACCLQTVIQLIDTFDFNWLDCRPTNRPTDIFKRSPTWKSRLALWACCLQTVMKLQLLCTNTLNWLGCRPTSKINPSVTNRVAYRRLLVAFLHPKSFFWKVQAFSTSLQ